MDENTISENPNIDILTIEENNNDREQNAPKRAKTSVPRILDGKYFTIDSIDKGKVVAKCTKCGETKRGHLTSTGNFKSHYKIKHFSDNNKLSEYLKGHTEEAVKMKTSQPTLHPALRRIQNRQETI